MSDEFHNPYHFVPFSDKASPDAATLTVAENNNRTLDPWPTHLTHDRSVPQTHSGRIVCCLTICELLALGSEQSGGDRDRRTPRNVSLYQIGGQWALPGSALRGLVSSIAETATNSALRVLENNELKISAGQHSPPVRLGTTHQYFPPDLLPLALKDGRRNLSLAEQLFGVVEDVSKGTDKPRNWQAFGLGSRLRFSNALASGNVTAIPQAMTSQILDSPKSQSHNMYFQPRSGAGYIKKTTLNPGDHEAKGRKFYLHQSKPEWITRTNDSNHQKASLSPLTAGTFWFHIDFDNLTKLELNLLCYALKPQPYFRHKLGMAKPLGLGSVDIEPVGLFLIDREKRYSLGPARQRYHQAWLSMRNVAFPSAYAREQNPGKLPESASPQDRAEAFRRAVPHLEPILEALEVVGDPGGVSHPVYYPQAARDNHGQQILPDSPAFEARRYQWFVDNDSSGSQHLGSLLGRSAIPVLHRGVAVGHQPPLPQPEIDPEKAHAESMVRQASALGRVALAPGLLIVVLTEHSRTALAAGAWAGSDAALGYKNLLILSPEKVVFYGTNEVKTKLAQPFAEAGDHLIASDVNDRTALQSAVVAAVKSARREERAKRDPFA